MANMGEEEEKGRGWNGELDLAMRTKCVLVRVEKREEKEESEGRKIIIKEKTLRREGCGRAIVRATKPIMASPSR